jgi:DNA primase
MTSSETEEIRQRLSIVEFIGRDVGLVRKGQNF